jgi:hypothetical protein
MRIGKRTCLRTRGGCTVTSPPHPQPRLRKAPAPASTGRGCGRTELEFDVQNTTPTSRDYARMLTREQIEEFERCGLNPTHPDGLDGHRRGQIAVARLYVAQRPWWRRWLPVGTKRSKTSSNYRSARHSPPGGGLHFMAVLAPAARCCLSRSSQRLVSPPQSVELAQV